MKKLLLVMILLVIGATSTYAQLGRIFFSASGGTNPSVATSFGEPLISSNKYVSLGSRKNTDDYLNVGIVPINTPANMIIMYPNPTLNDFTVHVSGKNENDFSIKVFDFTGRQIFSSVKNFQETKVSLEKFAPGIYLISVLSSGGTLIYNQKIVKQ